MLRPMMACEVRAARRWLRGAYLNPGGSMKPVRSLTLLLLALAACAPPPPATSGPDPAAPRQPDVVEPAEALDAAPRNWWLLDETANRVRGISAVRSYEELLTGKQPKRSVVVAIIDSGVDIEH